MDDVVFKLIRHGIRKDNESPLEAQIAPQSKLSWNLTNTGGWGFQITASEKGSIDGSSSYGTDFPVLLPNIMLRTPVTKTVQGRSSMVQWYQWDSLIGYNLFGKNYTIMRFAPAHFSICVIGLFSIAHAAPYATNTIHSNSDASLEIRGVITSVQPDIPPRPTSPLPPSSPDSGADRRLPKEDNHLGGTH
ncbi:hypothetical protein F5050DRAFT_1806243 [Lentinula boryana]|uniref:Phosphoglycerate mutase-like protein n=1 Tax=Lentinula boryana TaxID=40481 RepID=A0ABQ8QI20_9AGAR|nr:hypothetical protein F5050DRAFT_1806243 [Lentinula boryana]